MEKSLVSVSQMEKAKGNDTAVCRTAGLSQRARTCNAHTYMHAHAHLRGYRQGGSTIDSINLLGPPAAEVTQKMHKIEDSCTQDAAVQGTFIKLSCLRSLTSLR